MTDIVTILHTCDMHGHLTEAAARKLADLKQLAPTLLLDCGDAIRVGNLNPGIGRDQTFERMERAGYDALAMGNRETHLWWSCLRWKLRRAPCPVISSNLILPRGSLRDWPQVTSHPPALPYLLAGTASGPRVGVIALTPVMTGEEDPLARLVSVRFEDPLTAAGRIIKQLRPRTDALLCLCHLGSEMDRRLASAFPEIDLVIGGHDHLPGLPFGERVGEVTLARSDPYARSVGVVELDFGAATGQRAGVRSISLHPLPQ